eukprot:TRINITY_DN2531_c0_g1_i1.p1 TRINITY_DN2531_c0_g1~~TRINITY_DN2531_c0_g1_i1.p1  ORF type:complete len:772 (+),score=253.14 TRINITY_DN2531_c0_g1_i1:2081-4396(+)
MTDNDRPSEPCKIFVRNLPFTMKNEEFETMFSNIGPVKRAYVIKNPETGDSKGFGFVEYSLPEDAASAMEEFQNKEIEGRKLKLEGALQRLRPERPRAGRIVREQRQADEERRTQQKVKKNSNIDEVIELKEIISDNEEESEVESEVESDVEDDKIEIDVSKKLSENGAESFKSNFDWTKDCRGKIVLWPFSGRKRKSQVVTWLKTLIAEKKVPNINISSIEWNDGTCVTGTCKELVFNAASEEDCVGIINSLHHISSPFNTQLLNCCSLFTRRHRNWRCIFRNLPFSAKEKSLRQLAVQFGEVHEVSIPMQGTRNLGYGFVIYSCPQDAITAVNSKKVILGKRTLIVDLCLTREDYEMTQKNPDLLETVDVAQDNSVKIPKEKKEKKAMHSLFITNLPPFVEETSLTNFFKAFGRIKEVKIVRDPETKMCKGSAFISFRKEKYVQNVLEASDTAPLEFEGELLNVQRTVSRKELADIVTEREKQKLEEAQLDSDKRNLYLATEGSLTVEEMERMGMSKKDIVIREMAESVKKSQLQNTNTSISKVRLAVRNLPKEVDEKQLRSLFYEAAEINIAEIAEEIHETVPKRVKIVQVKIMRDDRKTDIDGNLRSRQFGFVEFTDHIHALCALRHLNNNPHALPYKHRLLIEFAIDSVRKLKKLDKTREIGKISQEVTEKRVVDKKEKKKRDKLRKKIAILEKQGLSKEDAKEKAKIQMKELAKINEEKNKKDQNKKDQKRTRSSSKKAKSTNSSKKQEPVLENESMLKEKLLAL